MIKPLPFSTVVKTRPPAKLNLFLELLGKREDGFHEIDTVMLPIDWCDQLTLQRTESQTIDLSVLWSPSAAIIARRLGFLSDSLEAASFVGIPADDRNLVYRALQAFTNHFGIQSGFRCELVKSIPAGAGLGGASSDAAAVLRSAAMLSGISPEHPDLYQLAIGLGSDVPFFLGAGTGKCRAARAQGRGERISQIETGSRFEMVVAFPSICLSTADVYSTASIPDATIDSAATIKALRKGSLTELAIGGLNRLQGPAAKIAPQIGKMLQSMWQLNLIGCQLTGSGSACFGFARSRTAAIRAANQLRSQHDSGVRVSHCRTVCVPSRLEMIASCERVTRRGA